MQINRYQAKIVGRLIMGLLGISNLKVSTKVNVSMPYPESNLSYFWVQKPKPNRMNPKESDSRKSSDVDQFD